MNTIYDNTFVLGQTSATNFIAGNGIKIDEPSAGTVRIGNDETVLWSGARTSACALSEDPTNFEAMEIYLDLGLTTRPKPVLKVTPASTIILTYGKGGNNAWMTWMNLTCSGTSLSVVHTKAFNFGAATATSWSNPSISVDSDEDFKSIYKVIGINRISGSNA